MSDDVESFLASFVDDAKNPNQQQLSRPPTSPRRDPERSGKPSARPAKDVRIGRALPLPSRRFAPDRSLGGRSFLLVSALRQTLRPIADLWADHPVIIAIDLPEGCSCETAATALRSLCEPLDHRLAGRSGVRQTNFLEVCREPDFKARKTVPEKQIALLSQELGERAAICRRLFLLIEHDADLAPEIAARCDHHVVLSSPNRRHIDAAFRLLLGISLSERMLDDLMDLPIDEIALVLRPGSTARQIDSALRRRAHTRADAEVAADRKRHGAATLSLATLPGMGAASTWGLELARDLLDWSNGVIPWDDVDRGVLLYGKPGTGKTSYAKALAASCSVPLIATSVTEWQSTGHLGDLLGAMRRSFKTARDQAPCILFLDELDSVGIRAEFSGDHKTYGIQVVNGLLECLDGVEAREGVVVVAACNDPTSIDPAILRSGRLDQAIEIPLPDVAARAAILRYHLGSEISATSDDELNRIAGRLHGWTGADIERLVREARRVARRSRRPLAIGDLTHLLPPPPNPSAEERRRFAIHEIGHALAVVRLGLGELIAVRIGHDDDGSQHSGAATLSRSRPPLVLTSNDLEAELVKMLVGTAAEAVILGSRSTGASGNEDSDLARATLLAARIELHHGLGDTPIILAEDSARQLRKLVERDAALRGRVEARLRGAFERAQELIRDHRDVAEVLAKKLTEKGEMTGAEVREIIDRCDRLTNRQFLSSCRCPSTLSTG